jgi:hypothetical protein
MNRILRQIGAISMLYVRTNEKKDSTEKDVLTKNFVDSGCCGTKLKPRPLNPSLHLPLRRILSIRLTPRMSKDGTAGT